ncbi:DUF6286 domain-containing protein [Rhodococcus sp. SGAir0479]|uniref:DUF6286 domain-containing protein n=1 Tax=Rhodococcus sp. SGAir0479 TaxID=2567884 RepID=UPI0010CD5456|nr:DUF6286 domain-containing protein [Rhodococcus sp. SGAir0479]QCQ93603.1 hypothetical protein E7742_21885 [Rhodococcus sp. SGAir0479]
MSADRHESDADGTPGDRAAHRVPAPARTPSAPPAASWAGALLAAALLAAGVIALRDTTIALGWVDGRKWVDAVVEWVDGLRFEPWMIPAGIAAVLLGVWMVVSAVRPRRQIALPLRARSAVWIRPADLAECATAAARTVPGVLEARSTATSRKLTVRATVTDAGDAAITTHVRDAIAPVIDTMQRRPKLVVRTRTGGR